MSVYLSYKSEKESLSSLSIEMFGKEVKTPREFFDLLGKPFQQSFLANKINQLSAKIIFISNQCEYLLDQQTNIYKLMNFLKRIIEEMSLSSKENNMLISSLYFSLKTVDQRGFCIDFIFENLDIQEYLNLFDSYLQIDDSKVKQSLILSILKKLLSESKISALASLTFNEKLKTKLKTLDTSEMIIAYIEFISLNVNSNIDSIVSSFEKDKEKYKEELYVLDLFKNKKLSDLLAYKNIKIPSSSLKALQSLMLNKILNDEFGLRPIEISQMNEMTKIDFEENEDLFIELFDRIHVIYKIDYYNKKIVYSYKTTNKDKVRLLKDRINKIQNQIKI